MAQFVTVKSIVDKMESSEYQLMDFYKWVGTTSHLLKTVGAMSNRLVCLDLADPVGTIAALEHESRAYATKLKLHICPYFVIAYACWDTLEAQVQALDADTVWESEEDLSVFVAAWYSALEHAYTWVRDYQDEILESNRRQEDVREVDNMPAVL